MIPDRNFLRRCAQKNNLELPRELEDWLLVHFEDEPYENFNTAVRGKVILQPQGKEFFTCRGKNFFTSCGKEFFT